MDKITKLNKFYRNSCKGKNAVIYLCSVTPSTFFGKNNIIHYVSYAHYKFMKYYLGYDNVYIFGNDINNPEAINNINEDNLLYNIKESILPDISKKNVLIDKSIDDVFIDGIQNNFFGGYIMPHRVSIVARLHEWYEYKNKNVKDNIFILQDDPQIFLTDPVTTIIERMIKSSSLKVDPKDYQIKNVNKDIDYIKNNCEDIENIFNEVNIGFVGIDYNIYFNNLADKDKPKNIIGWDNIDSHIWSGVNDFIEEKFNDGNYNQKKYDSIYVGANKNFYRTLLTEKFYKRLKNKFLHISGQKVFFNCLKEDEHFDLMKKIYYPQIYEVINNNAKSTFVTHNIETIGNQISPRFFDAMLSDNICFLDINFDEDFNLVQNEELRDFMYVYTPKDFSEKVDKISNDEHFYKHIKYLQRLEIYNKFNSYIEPENLSIWKEKLNLQ